MAPKYPVILASASPRRRELLRQLVPEFEVVVSNYVEVDLPIAFPVPQAEALAMGKAEAVRPLRPDALVIGSDTVVAVETEMSEIPSLLAKPVNEQDAKHMLWLLSGRTHVVVTGVALLWPLGSMVASDVTKVTFRDLTEEEIEAYVATGEPMDKAGAYAIQGGAAQFVEKTEGSISNVIGLPLELLDKMLAEFCAE